MGFFSKEKAVSTDERTIDELLSRGVSEGIATEGLRKRMLSGERLRIKLGIDPTSPHLHLGRATALLKLRDFQKLGHLAVLIVGDFTAVIGDTSDKEAERPMLSPESIEENKRTYMEQVGKLIDLSRAEFCYNSEWLSDLSYREIGEQADVFSVADFIARDNIRRRLDAGKRVSLREVLYPLMQGYDSVAVRADVELGGMDQKFNLLAGRALQEKYGQRPQAILMNPLIEGLDGRKMSSSWGNTIPLMAEPSDMYGKVMSMSDEQVPIYLEVCTRMPLEEVREIVSGLRSGSVHPKDAKMRLAREIVALYHGEHAAREAEDGFTAAFSEGKAPADIPEVIVKEGELLREAAKSVVSSTSELRRLVAAGAITDTVSGKVFDSIDTPLEDEVILRIGKHRFLKVRIRS